MQLNVYKFAVIFGDEFYDFASSLCTISRLMRTSWKVNKFLFNVKEFAANLFFWSRDSLSLVPNESSCSLLYPVMSLDVPGMRFGLNLTKITNLTVEKMWQWRYSYKNKSFLKHFKFDFLNHLCIKLPFLLLIYQMSFRAVSLSKLQSHFL